MFFEIVPMFVAKDFARRCFVVIHTPRGARARFTLSPLNYASVCLVKLRCPYARARVLEHFIES